MINNSTELTDSTLLKSLKRGDNRAFEIVFKTFFPRLYGYAKGMVDSSDLAEDLVQETLASVWENRYMLDEKGNLKSFLFKSVRNRCLNYLEHQKVVDKYIDAFKYESASQGLYMLDFLDKSESDEACSDMMDEVNRVLSTLSPTVKEAFTLSKFSKMKNREVADKMSLSVKTVEKHISKAMKLLKSEMKGRDFSMLLLLISIYSNS